MAEVTAAELTTYEADMTEHQQLLFQTEYNAVKKDRHIALALSVLFGTLGVDRFYIGNIGMGVLKLLTGGLCGILYVLDWFLIMGRTDDHNRAKAQEIAVAVKAMPEAAPPPPPPPPALESASESSEETDQE
jgi:TM2 domain-containing membrane protein YozV